MKPIQPLRLELTPAWNRLRRLQTRAWQWTVCSLFMLGFASQTIFAEPPSHDPARIIRNNDGRYWMFTTGQGVWCMSSSNANFTDWRAERAVFPSGWPGWISNYVSGFNGHFWAPDVVKMGNTYYCYYSCAGTGAPAAIGLATASDLNGPWTDRGMIVAGNNAIDPAILIDGGSVWMSYGNWQSGIDIVQINPSNGLRLGSGRWDIVSGQVEGPYIMKNGSYYYCFFQSGLCCDGCNSTYYVRVGRSTSPNGNYVDKNGVSLNSGGGTTFLPNLVGYMRGPGHIGFGEGRLTYHFYNQNASCAAQLKIDTLTWGADGWPVAGAWNPGGGGGGGLPAAGTYKLRNRGSGLMLDNLGATSDGADVGQWASSSSNNQRWVLSYVSSNVVKLRCVSSGKYLDGMGRTSAGSNVGQWANGSSNNQRWTIIDAGGGHFKLRNVATNLCVDVGASPWPNGDIVQQYPDSSSLNLQWQFTTP